MKRSAFRRRVAQHPKAVRPEELAQLLTLYGWEFDRQRGSHHTYVKAGGPPVTFPYRRPHVLAVYVKEVLALTQEDDDGE